MNLYRLLLHLYPASFRREYGAEMRADWDRQRARAASPAARARLWCAALADIAGSALAAHLETLGRDLRTAGRGLRREPGFAAAVMLVVALGVGANAGVFALVNHVLIEPLPFSHPEQLLDVYELDQTPGGGHYELSPSNYRDWNSASGSQRGAVAGMAAWTSAAVNLTGQGEPRRLDGARVTASLLPLLGVEPRLGRGFLPGDDQTGAEGAVVLSDGLWRQQFGADPGVVGREIQLDGESYQVIGVMPPTFFFPTREAALWTAMRFQPDEFQDRNNTFLSVAARLAPGRTRGQAQAELATIAARLAAADPRDLDHINALVIPFREAATSSQSRLLLLALMGAALCVLLIACMNLANLMRARLLARRRELALRSALGAGWERLLRQLTTECLLLGLCGGGLGVGVAGLLMPWLGRLVPANLPVALAPQMDARVLAAAAAATLAAVLAFGVLPAWRIARGQGLSQGLAGGRGSAPADMGSPRLRALPVIVEIAGCMVLLVCSGLLWRALRQVQATATGFNDQGVITMRTTLPQPKYADPAARARFFQAVLGPARALPGVKSAAYISFLPMTFRGGLWPVALDGRPQSPANLDWALLRFVTPGFFRTLDIPLLAGRDVAASDTRTSVAVAVVSASFARRYWPGADPLGRHFFFGNRERVVAGVAGEVRVRGLERASEPQVYLPATQSDAVGLFFAPQDLVVRLRGPDPMAAAGALRAIIRRADAEQPISDVRPLAEVVEADTAPRRVQITVLGSFALLALLLAGLGIYGLLAYAVRGRTREIGVRLALGARRGEILRMILREGLSLTAIGLGIGGLAAYGCARALASMLDGVAPADAASFAVAAGLGLLMALAGSLLPALRAVGVDPNTALRAE